MYYIKGHGWFAVRDSARKHGISDSDMCHEIAQAMVVVTVAPSVGAQVIIHAMPMRRTFLMYFDQG